MFKKLLSFALVLTMLLSVAMIAASAAQVEVVEDAADVPAEVGADADAATGAGNTISFDTNSAGWKNFDYVFFHIWAIDDDSFAGYEWGGKKQRGTDAGNGIWTYDLDAAGLTIQPGCQYAVIFANSNSMQTYNLLFGSECIGHTAACDGTTYENPEDSTKTATAAFWDGGIDASVYGPELKISSIGTVVGTCCAKSTTPYKMFVGFLTDTLANARQYSGKDDQALLDDTAKALGIGKTDVKNAITESGATVEWDETKSTLPADSDPGTGGNGGGNGGNGGNGGSGDNGGGTGGNGGSGGGSGSGSKTGQETTMLFVMLGMMVVAAGVIFFVRKRERA